MAQRLYLPASEMEVSRGGGAMMTYVGRDGAAIVADRDVSAALAAGAVRPHVQVAVGARGWDCPCGHKSVFRVCGRCGRNLDE